MLTIVFTNLVINISLLYIYIYIDLHVTPRHLSILNILPVIYSLPMCFLEREYDQSGIFKLSVLLSLDSHSFP